MRRLGPAMSAAALLALGCHGGDVSTPEIRLGLLALTEADYALVSGVPTIRGATLAVEEINERGGVEIDGRRHLVRLDVVEHDDHVESVTLEARRLINLEEIHALIGPQLSRHAIPVARIANDARVPMVSPMSSNPETTRGKPWVFRLAFLDEVQGRALAITARENVGAGRAAVLFDVTDPYSRDLTTRFVETFEAMGGTVVSESFPGAGTAPEPEAFRATLMRFAAEGAEAILLPIRMVFVEPILDEIEALGLDLPVLGTDSWDILTAMGHPAGDGALVTHQWSLDVQTASSRAFVRRWDTFWGGRPRTTAALTYDAVHVLAAAYERAGTLQPAAVRDALATLPRTEGVTGLIDFAGSGDPHRSVFVTQVVGDSISLLRIVDP